MKRKGTKRSMWFFAILSVALMPTCKKDSSVDFAQLDSPQEFNLYSAQGETSVSLAWSGTRMCIVGPCPQAVDPVRYRVFVSEGGPERFHLYKQLPASETSITVRGLQEGKNYLFQVVVIGKENKVVTTNRVMTSPISSRITDVLQCSSPCNVIRSTDGQLDALVTYRSSTGGTLVLWRDGAQEEVIRGRSQAPAWAPAERLLAYQSSEGLTGSTYPEHIYVYEEAQRAHRHIVGGQYRNIEPAWSPDGRSLLFLSNRGGDPHTLEIWRVDLADTAKLRRLTTTAAADETLSGLAASWSPDGGKIAYTTLPTATDHTVRQSLRIIEMDADGTDRRILVNSEWNDYNPVYSPSGDRMAFFSDRSGSREIWVMALATGTLRQLTYTDHLEQATYFVRDDLQWLSDGSGLYFTGAKNGAEYGFFHVGVSRP